jgi:hypothetical protein
MRIPTGEISKRTWIYQGKKRSAYGYSLTVIDDDGTRRRYRAQFPTRAEAQEALDANREELRNPKPAAPESVSFGDVIARLLDLKSRRRTVGEFKRQAEH